MKKKGLLLASISMVLVAVLALTTASFAWFTASMNPSVQTFDVNVTTGKSLLVSATETEGFKTTVTTADLVAVTANNLLQTTDDKLNAATPTDLTDNKIVPKAAAAGSYVIGDIAFSKPTATALDTGSFAGSYEDAFVAKEATAKTYHYVKFDLYFKSSAPGKAAAVTVKLDLSTVNSTSVYAGTEFYGVETEGDKKVKIPYAKSYQAQIAKVLRVAFVPDVTTKTGETGKETPNADKISTTAPITPDAIVFEPNSTRLVKTAAGDLPTAAIVDATRTLTIDGALTEADATGKITPSTDLPLFKLNAGKTAKMTVYIWIEGNDLDCVNEVSSALFRSNIKFVGVDA